MKKILALILASLLVFTLVSCGKPGTSGNDDGYDDYDEDVVDSLELVYGDDEDSITVYKPENGAFTTEEDGDILTLGADDFSWDAELMGYKYYGDHGIFSNKPFVDYYYAGEVSDEYTYYDEDGYYTDLEYDGSPVVFISYVYEEEGYDEEFYETFVGFEYEGSDRGLLGCVFTCYEDFEDEYLIATFAQIFDLDYDYEFEAADSYDDWDDGWDDEDEGFDTDMIVGEWQNVEYEDEVFFFFADDYATYTIDGEEYELEYSFSDEGFLWLVFETEDEIGYEVSFDGSDTMYLVDEGGNSIEFERL